MNESSGWSPSVAAAPLSELRHRASSLRRSLAWTLRARLFDLLSLTAGRPLLRLLLRRWPTRIERRQFRQGLHNAAAPLPPLLRGFAAVAGAREPLTRAMLLSWLAADEGYRGPMCERLASRGPPGDHLRVWTGPSVGLLHIEKTAGTALATMLSDRFHPAQIDADPYRSMPPHVLSAMPTHVARRLRFVPFVHGHYDLPALRRLGSDRVLIACLREPRARLLSLYQYWRSIDPALIGDGPDFRNVRFAHEHDLEDFLAAADPFMRNYLDNVYVRRLTGSYATDRDDPLARAPEAAVSRALDALRSIDIVGVTEHMDDSLALLSRVLGIDLPPRLPLLNDLAGNRRDRPTDFRTVPPATITPAAESALAGLTRLDRLVYEAARARLGAGLAGPAGHATAAG